MTAIHEFITSQTLYRLDKRFPESIQARSAGVCTHCGARNRVSFRFADSGNDLYRDSENVVWEVCTYWCPDCDREHVGKRPARQLTASALQRIFDKGIVLP